MIAPIFNIFITNFIVTITCFSAGKILIDKLKIKENFSISLIFGVLVLSQISLVLNFFTPINSLITYLLVFISIVYFFLQAKIKIKLFKIAIISFLSILFYFKGNHAEDFTIYHHINLQAINDYKIILGLTHLKLNLGQSPISFYGDAIFQNLPFIKHKMNYLSYILFCGLIFFLYKKIKTKEYFEFAEYFLIISSVYFLIKFSRLGAHGADFICAAIIIIGLYFFLKINFNEVKNSNNNQYIVLSSILISNAYFYKVFAISFYILLIAIFYLILKNKLLKKYYLLITFIVILNLAFFLKNFLISGCLIFPIPQTCFDNLAWGMGTLKINDWKTINEAWTKGWYNYFTIEYQKYILNFNWLDTWLKNHFLKSLEKFFVPIFAIITLIKFMRNDVVYDTKYKINIVLIFFTSLIAVLIWFFNSPLVRLGLIALIPFLIILLNLNLFKNFNFKIKKKNIFILLIVFPTFFIAKNTYRIIDASSNYEEYPYPRINKDNEITIVKENIITKKENGVFYKIYDGDKCFNIKFPCIIENKFKNKNFTFNYRNNYLILKNQNEQN